MKFASSATLLMAAALATLSAAQDISDAIIVQATAKPMLVKPGGLVTVTVEMLVNDFPFIDRRRNLQARDEVTYELYSAFDDVDEAEGLTFNKNGTKNVDNKRNKTETAKPDKPDKAARPGKGLNPDDDLIFLRASLKPNTWQPRAEVNTEFLDAFGYIYYELPEEGLVLMKKYTATFKYRVNQDVTSGEVLPVTVGMALYFNGNFVGEINDQVFVTVK